MDGCSCNDALRKSTATVFVRRCNKLAWKNLGILKAKGLLEHRTKHQDQIVVETGASGNLGMLMTPPPKKAGKLRRSNTHFGINLPAKTLQEQPELTPILLGKAPSRRWRLSSKNLRFPRKLCKRGSPQPLRETGNNRGGRVCRHGSDLSECWGRLGRLQEPVQHNQPFMSA